MQPADAKVIFLGGIFFILLLAALHAAAEIVWPLFFAFMLSLLLSPLVDFLNRMHVPRAPPDEVVANREQQGGFGGSQGLPNVIYAGGGPGGTPSGGGPSGGGPGGLSRPAGGSAGGGFGGFGRGGGGPGNVMISGGEADLTSIGRMVRSTTLRVILRWMQLLTL